MCLHFKAASIKIKTLPVTLIAMHNILGLSSVSITRIKGKKPGELDVPLDEMRPSPPTCYYFVETHPTFANQPPISPWALGCWRKVLHFHVTSCIH